MHNISSCSNRICSYILMIVIVIRRLRDYNEDLQELRTPYLLDSISTTDQPYVMCNRFMAVTTIRMMTKRW